MFGWLSLLIFRHFANLTSFSSTLLMMIEWLMKWNCGKKLYYMQFSISFCANHSEFQPKNTWFHKISIQLNCISSRFHCSFLFCTMHESKHWYSEWGPLQIYSLFPARPRESQNPPIEWNLELNWLSISIVCARFILNRFLIHWIETFHRYCWNVKTLVIPNCHFSWKPHTKQSFLFDCIWKEKRNNNNKTGTKWHTSAEIFGLFSRLQYQFISANCSVSMF